MSFLIDTDICSALLKGNGKVQSRFLLHTGRLNTSIITVGELWVWGFGGNVPSRRESALAQLLLDAPPILVDMDVAQEFGRVQLQLIKQGRRAPEMDLLIAATALVNDLTLVTHNTEDFVEIPNLRVIDWLD